MHVDLHGEVALVTGASQGIGRAIAVQLACAGAAVGLVARSRRDLELAAAGVESAGGRSLICELDLAEFSKLDTPISVILSRWGRLDILVNNAGVAPAEPPAT